MCGIAGIASGNPNDLRHIGAMTRALAHRGPDDEGYLVADSRRGQAAVFGGADSHPGVGLSLLPRSLPENSDLALGHRRLAILDLSPAGHGPMASSNGRYWVTYNGEIYNYVELREELRAHGHTFRSGTDTEVLLAAYAQWGAEALHRFNGMWAFALYDSRERTLFCARDRFGVKPFHYYRSESLFAFASEIKGLLAHPRVPPRPHEGCLAGFLLRGNLDEGAVTFFDGIRSLPAAHNLTLRLDSHDLSVTRWYDVPDREIREPTHEAFCDLLTDAVRLRLRSDVDVGTCLSGGLDSSTIVALTARLHTPSSGSRRRAFSVVYDDPGLCEAAYVDAMVMATGVEGRTTSATSADLVRDLPELVRAQDEPIPSTGPYSHWRVMTLAHEAGMKVLLDGQGADEILAGYHYQFGPFLAETLRRGHPTAAARELRAAARVTGRPAWFFLGLLGYHALPLPARLRRAIVGRSATHGYVPSSLLRHDWLASVGPLPGTRHAATRDLRAERTANLWRTSLPALLRYEDRNSMAFGIEARTPFLDYRLVELAFALPSHVLMRDGWTKRILRDATLGLLPDLVRLRRDKLGFPTPERRWLAEAAPQVRDWLAPGAAIRSFVRADVLDTWLARSDMALAACPGIWRLVSAELWLRYIQALGPSS